VGAQQRNVTTVGVEQLNQQSHETMTVAREDDGRTSAPYTGIAVRSFVVGILEDT
jgi:hypothetical protein